MLKANNSVSSVSIVNFEQVNVSWKVVKTELKLFFK